MALSIKSDEADRLARELATTTGESLTDAVVTALRQRLAREHDRRGPGIAERLSRLRSEVAAIPVVDPRSPEQNLGYDDYGLPGVTEAQARSVVVDTSAAVAILLGGPGGDELAGRLDATRSRILSAASRVELSIVLESRLGAAGTDITSRFVRDAEIEIVAVDTDIADRAVSAWRRFGKGRHRAALNFGDCFVYALAERTGLPIVCAGEDFARTDLEVIRAVT